MAKRILEDIKPSIRKSSRGEDVKVDLSKNNKHPRNLEIKPVSEYKEHSSETIKADNDIKKDEYFEHRRFERTPQLKSKPKLIHKFTLIVFILSILTGGVYWYGHKFEKANVVITAKHKTISLNNKQFIASKEKTGNSVDFEIMILSDKKTKNVVLSESKNLSLSAKGSVYLYNEYSSTPQKIIAGTFLSDDKGKAYKTDFTVSIPGYKIDKDKKIIPGQISVDITAFLPGEAYNGSPVSFHINSFKDTVKYSKIYGKLKTPLSGGASGLSYIINDSDKKNINNLAETSVKDNILEQVKAQIPEGYLLYKGATNFSYEYNDKATYKETNAQIEILGTVSVVLLNKKSLTDNIINNYLKNITEGEKKEISLNGIEGLSFSFTDKNQVISKEIINAPFLFSGNIDAIWSPDTELLKTKLLGINKNELSSIFGTDLGISSAYVKIFPRWQKYMPNDISKIEIKVN